MHVAQTLRVVVADDNDADREIISRLLSAEKNFIVDQASSDAGLMSLLTGSDVDCVVVDRTLGTGNGFEIHDRLRTKYLDPPAVIMLTSAGNERLAIQAFRGGFSDYVKKKPLISDELIMAVRQAVDHRRAEKNRRAELEYLAGLALCDRVTGLPNRQYLERRLGLLFDSRGRRRNPFAMVMISVNELAAINDSFGHAVGDAALKAFAGRMMQISRASEIFGSLGDGRFLYLIDSDVTMEAVEGTCRRLAEALSLSFHLETVGLSLSPSIGAAIYPFDGVTADELLDAAGRARSLAKSTGGGYVLASTARSSAVMAEAERDSGNGRVEQPEPDGPAAPEAELFPESFPAAPSPADSSGSANSLASDSHPQPGVRENRRSEHRQRVLKAGVIVTNDGHSTVDCVIRDLSPHGARVFVEAPYAPPPRFSLLIVETGNRIPAETQWQRGRDIGLRFLSQPAA